MQGTARVKVEANEGDAPPSVRTEGHLEERKEQLMSRGFRLTVRITVTGLEITIEPW